MIEPKLHPIDHDKCENEPCSCRKVEGQRFCSPKCDEAAHHGDDSTSDVSVKHCDCAHGGCVGAATGSDPAGRLDVIASPHVQRDVIAVDPDLPDPAGLRHGEESHNPPI